ncbi:MAG TPA: hypothetical protein VFP22_06250, partial [Candidatus Limnocylindrales bacterium]|nr:hypothetical protein [Candidatus Limnocylindrales bacterium]
KPKPKTGTTADVLGRYGAPSTARTYITRQEADRVWELLREMMKDPDSTFFAGSRFTDATRVNPHQAQLCKLKGHDWVEIGKSMFHTPIKRCVRCGEYDPPRKET